MIYATQGIFGNIDRGYPQFLLPGKLKPGPCNLTSNLLAENGIYLLLLVLSLTATPTVSYTSCSNILCPFGWDHDELSTSDARILDKTTGSTDLFQLWLFKKMNATRIQCSLDSLSETFINIRTEITIFPVEYLQFKAVRRYKMMVICLYVVRVPCTILKICLTNFSPRFHIKWSKEYILVACIKEVENLINEENH